MPKPARQTSHVAPKQFEAFGELLRHLRRRAMLTQRDLGQAVGYSEAQITRLERGQRLPDPVMVKGLFLDALDLKNEPEMAWRLVELAFLDGPAQVTDAVAGALGLKMQSSRSVRDLICDFFRDRPMLLILDNCEHLVAACATLAQDWLQRCSRLHILATSREMLRVPGEILYRVAPLALPPAAAVSEPHADVNAYARYSAIELFINHARTAQPDFALTPHNAPAIAHVCRRLDGIPLAIELAAAQMRTLAVEQLASRLEQGLHLRLDGNRAGLPQHQTLHATLDWSHSLLNDAQQVLFRRFAIFNGSFSLEMAEAVCAGLFDVLIELIDKSLLVPIQVGDDMRYRLLDTIRDYGHDRLIQSGEMPAIWNHFVAWAAVFAEATAAQINSPEKTQALREVALAYDNLHAVLQ